MSRCSSRSDEEAGSSRCVKAFPRRPRRWDGRRRRRAHALPRGDRAPRDRHLLGHVHGHGGPRVGGARARRQRHPRGGALVGAGARLRRGERGARATRSLAGIRLNLGVAHGRHQGQHDRLVGRAALRRAAAARPGPEALLAGAHRLAAAPRSRGVAARDSRRRRCRADPGARPARVAEAEALAARSASTVGQPVDFWTEAALFSREGIAAVVYGPGDIAQAHTAGEWVALRDLAARRRRLPAHPRRTSMSDNPGRHRPPAHATSAAARRSSSTSSSTPASTRRSSRS